MIHIRKRRLLRATDLAASYDLAASLDGARLQGGCAHCDAYQEVQAGADGQRGADLRCAPHRRLPC